MSLSGALVRHGDIGYIRHISRTKRSIQLGKQLTIAARIEANVDKSEAFSGHR
jgi:hypothetical protein